MSLPRIDSTVIYGSNLIVLREYLNSPPPRRRRIELLLFVSSIPLPNGLLSHDNGEAGGGVVEEDDKLSFMYQLIF